MNRNRHTMQAGDGTGQSEKGEMNHAKEIEQTDIVENSTPRFRRNVGCLHGNCEGNRRAFYSPDSSQFHEHAVPANRAKA
jgi:hypothetical protein